MNARPNPRPARATPLLALAIFAIAAAGAGVAMTSGNASASGQGHDNARIRIGYRIAPVPLDLTGKNRALVGMGSYLVNSPGACVDCHTNPAFLPGGDPFLGQQPIINQAGYLAGGKAYGPFVSRNLTPDKDGLPADLDYSQFRFVMRTGADVKGLPPFVPNEQNDTLQVMPWPFHSNMSEYDIRAMYEYLRAIPCVGDAARCGS